MNKKSTGYPIPMTKEGLLELKDPANRDHPDQRWGQAVVIKFCGTNYPTYKTAHDLFYADDVTTEKTVNRFILDYNL